ncbi:GNAT family N-acetyltransferase [Colwellia sp. 4_MG-2023]|uniref:GNAT family N-acetyltransferase n=1 Tax=unclassified Colwellia TaxID=196834 RepID=UPI001C087038|nr:MULTISPECIES: GNAT family N-acetyltransferase [unclassified Colwellia]MBU2923366.1 GNAT family N-acetyltransferase [Colwellia sp. C2M11]MDO6486999.1 GNAT family N-acetyltransferase [Colwellia sp. 6_MG-2023]MDO6507991.1 GNAT family N-acetyltransferase [Colwellia sp. 5_MG-2023]MDO6556281.1 GNAT family N-acetyltransferase [Colwellia sp. 4_MG-2023]MDO6653726.1 GNAT family N-acetyltransferase [Colwellia sp. 3_MG-2023]
MNSDKYDFKLESPLVEEFLNLRNKVGWGELEFNLAQTSLNNSLFHVTVRDKSVLIGMGRIVGDGAMYFYIQDVIVDPSYQGTGVGSILMDQIENYLSVAAQKGSTVGLLAAKGKEDFYIRYDYMLRPSNTLGSGMCKFV